MNKRLLLKIIAIYFAINCVLFLKPESDFLLRVSLRFIPFSIIGALIGRYMYIKMNYVPKNFGIKVIVSILIWFFYYSQGASYKTMILYNKFCSLFYEITFEDINNPPLVVFFIYDSFIEDYALLSYILSYFFYGVTIYILNKCNHSATTRRG